LVREQENADARAEEQAAEIEKQKLAIEQERQKLDEQKKRMAEDAAKKAAEADEAAEKKDAKKDEAPKKAADTEPDVSESIADRYSLVEIVGAGNQLFATVESLGKGKQKKLSVGKLLDGYTVRSISLDDGVEFEKDGDILTIGVGSFGADADKK
jgi:type IV pilus biogenesis protein PilP